MKRLVMAVMLLLVMIGVSFAGTYSAKVYTSAEKTADAIILATKGAFRGIAITPDGTNVCKVVIYDNASAYSGTILWEQTIDAGSKDTKGIMLNFPMYADNGITADITIASGTCTYVVFYQTYIP